MSSMEQWRGKYPVQNYVTNEIKEIAQMAYMLIFQQHCLLTIPKETRLQWVKDYYDAVSTFYISLSILLWLVLGHPTTIRS